MWGISRGERSKDQDLPQVNERFCCRQTWPMSQFLCFQRVFPSKPKHYKRCIYNPAGEQTKPPHHDEFKSTNIELPSISKDEHNNLRCLLIFSDHQGTELYISMNIIWVFAANTPTGRVFSTSRWSHPDLPYVNLSI